MSSPPAAPAAVGVPVLPVGLPVDLLPPRRPETPVLRPDAAQAGVVARRQGSGPVVVLGAPGTGKTTTLLQAVATRVRRDGVTPSSVLVLAPQRQAAAALRERLSALIGGTLREPMARTPHSYAFGLLRRWRVLAGEPAPVLISGPEQDRVLAELLAGHVAGDSPGPRWPDVADERIRGLRGFRGELRELLMRAVERGVGPDRLRELGERQERPEWVAAAAILAEYQDVTALATPGAYDPAGIVDEATAVLTADRELLQAERFERALVVVDDVQEMTAATERLLGLLAGDGHDLLLAGDPDAATQTFRGARPRAVAEIAARFGADVVVLGTAHRHGPVLRGVTRRVAARIGSGGLVRQRGAEPGAGPEADESAQVHVLSSPARAAPADESAQVHVLSSPAREGADIAAWLRRHHLVGGVGWARMAVVVRSTRDTAPIRRALAAAGVPVAVPTTEVPVRDEPAVVPLRQALRCALQPEALGEELAADLLTGPLGGADAIAMRRLRQGLRADELAAGGGRESSALIPELLENYCTAGEFDSGSGGPEFAPARRVARVLAAGRAAAAAPGATAETVLWALWAACGLAEPWRRLALGGGVAGERADRDLDAVMALFEAAARFVDRFPRAGPLAFLEHLEGQEVPADTLAEHAPTDEAVALVTAQGAAGREWDVVAVAGVQEGTWPDLRVRGSLLDSQRLADLLDGRAAEAGDRVEAYSRQRRAVLDDELRLFHVAVSRARRHLLVSAVRSEDEMPSALVDLVDPDEASDEGLDDAGGAVGPDLRPLTEVAPGLTLPALVARLRAVVTDDAAAAERRVSAARQLARLAAAGVPGADPVDWYGLAPLSADGVLRGPGAAVPVSPSTVESFQRCALRWLLDHVGGRRPPSSAQELGNLVHELAEEVPDGDRDRLLALLEDRFDRLGLGQGWVAQAELARARAMIEKLVEYVRRARTAGRELIDVERSIRAEIGRAVVSGSLDRLERDAEGRLVVVDLKTGKSGPSQAEVARHAQLGVYQLAVEAGAVEGGAGEHGATPGSSGGAELVQLGKPTKSVVVQHQSALADDPEPGWAQDLVRTVAEGMAGSAFAARDNPMCRMCSLRRSCPMQTEGRQVTDG